MGQVIISSQAGAMTNCWCSLERIPRPWDLSVTLVNTVILYEASARDNAIRLGRYFKDKGLAVQSMKRRPDKEIEDYKAMAAQRHMRNLLYLKGEGLVVTAMDMVNHSADEIPVSAYE